MEKKEFEFYVAGVRHHEIYRCLDEMKVGDHLMMEPEPMNKYDANAICLEYSSLKLDTEYIMIGYVPHYISAEVTNMLGPDVYCEITELNKEEKPWKQVKVVIKETQDTHLPIPTTPWNDGT